jgi:hypothetical protein
MSGLNGGSLQQQIVVEQQALRHQFIETQRQLLSFRGDFPPAATAEDASV